MNSKKGRPSVNIQWPEGSFSIYQLKETNQFSFVTLSQKIKLALKNQEIEKIGKESVGNGRPRLLYKKKSAIAAQQEQPIQSI